MNNFDEALERYMAAVRELTATHYKVNGFTHGAPEISAMRGPKYVRIVKEGPHRSVWSFVEIETGNVLKAAGWKKPAPHARANIYSPTNGIENHSPYGPNYLR